MEVGQVVDARIGRAALRPRDIRVPGPVEHGRDVDRCIARGHEAQRRPVATRVRAIEEAVLVGPDDVQLASGVDAQRRESRLPAVVMTEVGPVQPLTAIVGDTPSSRATVTARTMPMVRRMGMLPDPEDYPGS